MLALLKRKVASDYAAVLRVLGGSWIWVGAATEGVACLSGAATRGSKPMGMGLLQQREAAITVHVELAKLPGGTMPLPTSRFYISSTEVKEPDNCYKVESIKSLPHMAGWIEITGSKDS